MIVESQEMTAAVQGGRGYPDVVDRDRSPSPSQIRKDSSVLMSHRLCHRRDGDEGLVKELRQESTVLALATAYLKASLQLTENYGGKKYDLC